MMYTPTRNGSRIVGDKFVLGQWESKESWDRAEGLNLDPVCVAGNWIKAKRDRGQANRTNSKVSVFLRR